ncbi:MAG: hypothetical protein SFZ02_18935 [bacterium]|nr:hypothetical protein [bacterium]
MPKENYHQKRVAFGNTLRLLRDQAHYMDKRMSGDDLVRLINHKLRISLNRPDNSEWETAKTIPPPPIFCALLEIYTFQNILKTWDAVQDLITHYIEVATDYTLKNVTFDEATFNHWQAIRQALFNHAPEHILSDNTLYGVDAILDIQSNALLEKKHKNRAISFEGEGGLGKTSLAVSLAIRLGQLGIFEGIYFMGLRHSYMNLQGIKEHSEEQIETLDSALLQLASQIGISIEQRLSQKEKLGIIADYYHNHPILIILDNLETQADVIAYQPLIAKLLAVESASRLIITSRYQTSLLIPAIPLTVTVDELDKINAHATLRKYKFNGTQEQAFAIHNYIGGNPLALRLTMNLVQVYNIAPTLQLLEKKKSDLQGNIYEFREELFKYLYEKTLESLDEPIQDLFICMGLFCAMEEGATLDKIRKRAMQPNIEAGLKQLMDFHLVSFNQSDEKYTMHRLTIYYIRKEFFGKSAEDFS